MVNVLQVRRGGVMVDIATLSLDHLGGIEVGCVEQGLTPKIMSVSEAIEWFQREQTLWAAFQSSKDPAVSGKFESTSELSKIYDEGIAKIISALKQNNPNPAGKYFIQSSNYNLLIVQSRLGEAVFSLEDITTKSITALSLSRAWRPRRNEDIDLILVRSTLLASNALISTSDINRIEHFLESSKENLDQSKSLLGSIRDEIDTIAEDHSSNSERVASWLQNTQRQLTDFQEQKIAELDQIRDLYHSKMQTEAAAVYWRNKARAHRWIAWPSLLVFVAMVATPMATGWLHFDALKAFLIEITAATADKFSLTPVVALSIPVVGYGWLLRHVSRLFVQNLTLADDASYRRVMSMTFLGLAKDPASGISDAERGIILNALFRPAPPNAGDEGPPTGLLDLINPKKS